MADYRRTFNLGIGMILVVGKRKLTEAQSVLRKLGEASYLVGEVVLSSGPRVQYVGRAGERN
jgi:phosphoribosylaminoimidazole (AIR) synthetase